MPAAHLIALHEAGTSLVLDLSEGRLPTVLHWGAVLADLVEGDGEALIETGIDPIAPNGIDVPMRLALLPEHWAGWAGRPGLSGSRRGAGWSPKFTTRGIAVDGEELAAGGGVRNVHGPSLLEVRAADEEAQLELTLRIETLPGGVRRAGAELRNLGEAYQVDDLVLAFPVPSVADELLDFAGRWGKERTPQRRAMEVGTHLREGRRGRTGADAATLLHLGTPGFDFATGEIWAVHTGWSGNHTHYAERVLTGHQVLGGGELLLPGEVVLGTGETYTSPWVYAAYGVGLDDVARRFHHYLRSRPQHPSADRPVTLNVWEAVYFDHDADRLIELARRAADLGIERFVLDDGWFGARRDDHAGLGDWTVSADVWPDGLHPLVDAVTGLGMQFGLWFEPEMINLDSDVARAHPEWVMAARNDLPVESRFQQVINLGIPECYAYIRDALLAMLDEYAISYIKWDHNRDLIEAGTQPSGRPGVHEQTLALYRLMDELRAAHPELEIESCSSGGARVDLGVLQRTDRVWVSDCIDPLERLAMHRWTTQLIPPELMGAHIASGRSHTTGRMHDLDFRASTALFGHLGVEWDIARASADDLEELGAWIAAFKEHRRLLLGGELVRIDHPDAALHLHGVVAGDRSEAIFAVSSLSRSEVVFPGRLRFAGLDPKRRYAVTPMMLDRAPVGLKPPSWWHVEQDLEHEYAEIGVDHHPRYAVRPGEQLGTVLPGDVLQRTGLATAAVHPEHTLLYRLVAVD